MSEKFAEGEKLAKGCEGKLFMNSVVLVVLHVKPFDGVPGKDAHRCCLQSCLFTGGATHCWPLGTAGTESCRSHTCCKSLPKGAHYTTQVENSILPLVSLQCSLLTKLNIMKAGKGEVLIFTGFISIIKKQAMNSVLGPLRQQLGKWLKNPFPLTGKTLQ